MTKAIWTCRAFLLGYFLVLHFTADTYTFLILNVGLAYIPFEIAVFLTKKPRVWWIFWPLGIVWLVFFPNAPYLLTDLLHLQRLEIYGQKEYFQQHLGYGDISLILSSVCSLDYLLDSGLSQKCLQK